MNSEATNLQLKTISVTQNEDIHAVQDKSSSCHDDKSKKSTIVKAKTCTFFSKAHPFEKGKCPVWGVKCTRCGGQNHFATTITSIAAQLEMIHAHTQAHDYPAVIYTEMFVDKKETRFQVDSSTSMNVIPVKFVADKKPESITKMLQMWSTRHLSHGVPVDQLSTIQRTRRSSQWYSLSLTDN